jgi:Na+/melibiose symporter-like transporter
VVGAVCATLMPGRNQTVAIRVAILCASTIMLIIGVVILFSRAPARDEEVSYLALTSLVHVCFMSFVLLLYRRLGYRLRRRGGPVDTVTNNSASAK